VKSSTLDASPFPPKANLDTMPALIVGAGIGGLACGLALRRAGWDIRIFEQADTPRAIGFALALAPNAIAALRELGVVDRVMSQSVTPMSGEMRRIGGRVLRCFAGKLEDLRKADLTSLILRKALHDALLERLGPEAVAFSHAAAGFHHDGAGVRLDLANGATATGDILVGADGIGSVIRAQLHPEEPPARPSGYFAIRGLSPAVDRMNGLQALWYFGRGVESGVVQASSDAIYWFVSLLADDVRAGPIDVQSVMRRLTARFDDQFHAITGATPPNDMRIDELFAPEKHLARWGAGRVTLLGDAAHPMLPHTGQGAAQALEDAVALGRVFRSGGDYVAALRRYENVRGRRTRRIVRTGPWIARVTTTRNRLIGTLRDTAIRLIPAMMLEKALSQGPRGDPYRGLE
jgi:2-polyprenyl-6-methoxyphenol hydroxylase-like FAD-dependent oxidoreductase